jgi:hypothetical protein
MNAAAATAAATSAVSGSHQSTPKSQLGFGNSKRGQDKRRHVHPPPPPPSLSRHRHRHTPELAPVSESAPRAQNSHTPSSQLPLFLPLSLPISGFARDSLRSNSVTWNP